MNQGWFMRKSISNLSRAPLKVEEQNCQGKNRAKQFYVLEHNSLKEHLYLEKKKLGFFFELDPNQFSREISLITMAYSPSILLILITVKL